MQVDNYVVKSLELHLFFARIMKEHALFLQAGFTPAGAALAHEAECYRQEFEKLLCHAVALGNGVVSQQVLRSGEIVTEFTPLAERQTEQFTGIEINKEITAREMRLNCGCRQCSFRPEMFRQVKRLNQTALKLLDGLIALKEKTLSKVLCCEIFTLNYPLLIEHIIREAKLYRDYVAILEKEGRLSDGAMKDFECFWNQIMMEHALFIRGLLDPCENELYESADDFAKEYCELLESSKRAHNHTMAEMSLEETLRFREFKMAGTRGIEQCKIRSIILPLLADHVLREANHYIRLLRG
ncbi:MAG: DUF2935 domain-containing protein [Lachnospiraceae bacterium]